MMITHFHCLPPSLYCSTRIRRRFTHTRWAGGKQILHQKHPPSDCSRRRPLHNPLPVLQLLLQLQTNPPVRSTRRLDRYGFDRLKPTQIPCQKRLHRLITLLFLPLQTLRSPLKNALQPASLARVLLLQLRPRHHLRPHVHSHKTVSSLQYHVPPLPAPPPPVQPTMSRKPAIIRPATGSIPPNPNSTTP